MSASRILKLTNQGQLYLYEPSAGGSSKVILQAPALAADWTLTLPVDDGAADSLLRSDGAGVTSWVTSLGSLSVTTLTATDMIVNDELRVTEPGGPSYVSVVAPALAANWTLTLPADDGVASSLLMSDGSGTTSWVVAVPAFDVDALATDGLTVHNQGTVNFREAVAGGTEAVKLRAPAALAADVTFTLPGADGGADDVLVTDGAGNLSFKETLASLTITALTSAGILITNEGLLTFREEVGHGVNEVTFKAPHSLAADTDYTWPTAIVAGNFLQTDVNGNLSWAASASTLQTAYDAGEDIVMIADTIDISQANDNTMISLTKTGVNAGNPLSIHNDGTAASILIETDGAGNSIRSQQDGAGYGWYHTQNGGAQSIVLEQNTNFDVFYCTQAGASTCLNLNKTNAGAGVVISINNDGTGDDMSSVHGGWNMTNGGGLSLNGLRFIHDHLTVTAGSMTVDINDGYITVASHDANPEFIDTINGGTDGQILIIRLLTGSANITARHNVGNVHLDGGANFGFDDPHDMLMLIYEATSGDWCEISRANNA